MEHAPAMLQSIVSSTAMTVAVDADTVEVPMTGDDVSISFFNAKMGDIALGTAATTEVDGRHSRHVPYCGNAGPVLSPLINTHVEVNAVNAPIIVCIVRSSEQHNTERLRTYRRQSLANHHRSHIPLQGLSLW
jgi:hypothetical protein